MAQTWIMGVCVSQKEAKLFELARDVDTMGLRSDVAKGIRRRRDLLIRDIERVADWKALHG